MPVATVITSLMILLAYLGIASLGFRPNRPDGAVLAALAAMAMLGAAWTVFALADGLGWLSSVPSDLLTHLDAFGLLAVGLAFRRLGRQFLRLRAEADLLTWLGIVWLVALLLVDSGQLVRDDVVLAGRGWQIMRAGFVLAALAAGWGLVAADTILMTLRTYRRSAQPLHRNRLVYWSAALALQVAGSGLFFLRLDLAGAVACALGVAVATVAILRYRLPDLRRTVFETWANLLMGLVTVAAYAAALLAGPMLLRELPVYAGWGAIAGLAVFLVVAVNPLVQRGHSWLIERASGGHYDAQRIVGAYSLSISNILDLERLASTSLALMREAIGFERGALFTVDHHPDPAGRESYHLHPLPGLDHTVPSAGLLLPDSPIAHCLRTDYKPLTQYDIDLLPRFSSASATERVWLARLGMDVYVPIYAHREWIGLFALGPKRSRHRYFDADLQLLSTLADQTAVALQNARLVADLVKLHAGVKEANIALDQANQRLGHLDRTKTDFINIISHELRTPLAILHGYSHLLSEEFGQHGGQYLQMVQAIASSTTRMNHIIESMLDVTKIDSRALQLHSNPVHLDPLLHEVLAGLEKPLADRHLGLEVSGLADLPAIAADLEALRKVFYQLVVNAIKFTPDGGKLSIAGRRVEDVAAGSAVEIVVVDNGVGIDPRFLELIFTKFYQTGEAALHSTGQTKFKGGGPGLGLAIARGITEAHGGRLWAESPGYDEEACPGSRFIVLLPIRDPDSASAN